MKGTNKSGGKARTPWIKPPTTGAGAGKRLGDAADGPPGLARRFAPLSTEEGSARHHRQKAKTKGKRK